MGMTPRNILDAIHEGLEETALFAALGYDATQGRPSCRLLNNALERRGYGRPIDEQAAAPDEWIRAIAKTISGRPDAPLHEVILMLTQKAANPPVGLP